MFSGALKTSSGFLAKTSIVEGANMLLRCRPLADAPVLYIYYLKSFFNPTLSETIRLIPVKVLLLSLFILAGTP